MIQFKPASRLKLFALTLLAAVLAILFSFIGAPLLRVLHNVMGSRLYWLSGLCMAGALIAAGGGPLGFLVLGLWVTIGLYGEWEKKGRAGVSRAIWAVVAGTLVSVMGPILLFRALGFDLAEALRESLGNVLKQIPSSQEPATWLSGVKIDADFLVGQMPGMMGILILTSLAFALILDRRVAFLTGLRFERVASQMRLLEFRLPDGLIWVAMISFLLSFLKVGIPLVSTIALNVFNVLVAAYFFQGLAVLETAFLALRVGFLIRMVIYVFVVGQLFFVLSLVGLIDYWADFRRRLRGISTPENGRKNGEHV